ncbi:pyridoxamine 5'-phosphate oxidase family protein [Streptomyces sp. NPDC060194]|uniref:pyridoxamine 5'-phosphate oxidase family protein n=1 Tax=Streptomyces sp. NPDC060194 TaxID=3347069 RepID=UPI003662E89C
MAHTTPPPLDRDTVTAFVRRHGDGVLSTIGPDGAPQSAYLTLATTELHELVLDARRTSRKVTNLRTDPRVSLVIGGPDGVTLQAEGLADLPAHHDLTRCTTAYRTAFPHFAASLTDPAIAVVRITLTWARLADHRSEPAVIRESTDW